MILFYPKAKKIAKCIYLSSKYNQNAVNLNFDDYARIVIDMFYKFKDPQSFRQV